MQAKRSYNISEKKYILIIRSASYLTFFSSEDFFAQDLGGKHFRILVSQITKVNALIKYVNGRERESLRVMNIVICAELTGAGSTRKCVSKQVQILYTL